MNRGPWIAWAILLLTGCQSAPGPQPLPEAGPRALQGSSWRLVQLNFSDGTHRAAIDRSRYTVGFGADGVLNVRFDCNRGRQLDVGQLRPAAVR